MPIIPDVNIGEATKASWAQSVKTNVHSITEGHGHDGADSKLIDYATIGNTPITLSYGSSLRSHVVPQGSTYSLLSTLRISVVLRYLVLQIMVQRIDDTDTWGRYKLTYQEDGQSEGILWEDTNPNWGSHFPDGRDHQVSVDMNGYLWSTGTLRIYSYEPIWAQATVYVTYLSFMGRDQNSDYLG